MKRIIVIILVLAVVGGVGYWAYGQYTARQQAEAAAAAAAEAEAAGDLEQVIWASGKLQPVIWAGLAPAGRVLSPRHRRQRRQRVYRLLGGVVFVIKAWNEEALPALGTLAALAGFLVGHVERVAALGAIEDNHYFTCSQGAKRESAAFAAFH